MHRALGAAGGAGGIEPEARIVRPGGGGLLRIGDVRGDEGLELDLGRVQRRDGSRDDHLLPTS